MELKAMSMLPKGILLGIIKKAFEKKAGHKVTDAKIFINYNKDVFTLTLIGKDKTTERSKPVIEFTEFSDILLQKVREKIACEKINIIDLKLSFETKITNTTVYFLRSGNAEKMEINDLF